MRKFFLFLCLAIPALISAQDKIVLHTGEVLYGKVEEVGISEIKYKKQDNLTGPVYVLSKNDVHAIHYENGTKDEFAKKEVKTEEKKEEDYVKKEEEKTKDAEDDVYSNGKDKKTRRKHHHHDHVDVVVPVWHAIGWIILADIILGCF